MFDIHEELKKLPDQPGVYLMHDEKDEIIYVGKAISLKKRVRQYFQHGRRRTPKIERMIERIVRFEYIVTDSEMEALILENNLIKEYSPRYNTMLKDDKTYPYIKVTVGEDYPRVIFTRNVKRDGARYFGPYTDAGAVHDIIVLMRKIFHIRSCSRRLPEDTGKDRPCLDYHIKNCDGPCQGYVSRDEYRLCVDRAIKFLDGDHEETLSELKQKMLSAADELDFETAAAYKELWQSAQRFDQAQKVTNENGEDYDLIAFARDESMAVMQVFFIRGGKMIGRDNFHLTLGISDTDEQIITGFVKQFYSGTPFVPGVLMLQCGLEEDERSAIEEWLSAKRGQKAAAYVPKKGDKARLMDMARRNAQIVLEHDKEKLVNEDKRTSGAVHELEELLGICPINRIESYDISNTNGFQPVGSMVVYEYGRPKRADYRKFRIKTVTGPDDYASMTEVLTRRFRHGLEEKSGKRTDGGFECFPDLILMDGGKGQITSAKKALGGLGLDIPVCGMVKDDRHRTRALLYEGKECELARDSEGFKLVTRIQDEVHRFAIEYHRSLRGADQTHSVLDDIPGIGEKRRKALMRNYRTMDELKAASVEELAAVESMNRPAAQSVYDFLHGNA